MAALLVDHVPLYPRTVDAGAAVQDDRGFQTVRHRLSSDRGRTGHLDGDNRHLCVPAGNPVQQDKRFHGDVVYPSVHRHCADESLSLSRQPAGQGGVKAVAAASHMRLSERLGFRRPSGVSEAGWGRTAVATIVSLIYFFPVLWIIMTAFKSHHDALAIPPKFIFTPTLENFVGVFSRPYSAGADAQATNFDLYFFNSIFIAGTSVFLALVIGTLAAFGFSRYPLKGNDTYLFIILTTRMLSAIVVIIPVILMFRVMHLAGSYVGIIALYTAFNLPFTIWMMKSFFDELSLDVEDAARIDGSSDTRVFFKICLPQVIAGLAATAVFGLILTWNEYLFALLLSGVETRTVPVAMAQTIGGDIGVRWGLLAAIETLFLIPVIIVTFALQNHLLRGVTFGTIKR